MSMFASNGCDPLLMIAWMIVAAGA